MKTSRNHRSSTALALAITAGLLAAFSPLGVRAAPAASAPAVSAEQKMNLMAQALAARDEGDLAKARDLLLQLQKLAPDDAFVKKDLAEIDADIARRSQGQATVFGAAGQAGTTATPAMGAAVPARSMATDTAPATKTGNGSMAMAGNTTAKPDAKPAPAPTASKEAMDALNAKAAADRKQILAAGATIQAAQNLVASKDFAGARAELDKAKDQLPEQGIGYDEIKAEIDSEIADTWYAEALNAYNNNKNAQANDFLKTYIDLAGNDAKAAQLEKALNSAQFDPTRQDEELVSPGFAQKELLIKQLITKGRAQYLYGDYQGALKTFEDVIAIDADNYMANAYEKYVTEILRQKSFLIHDMTREDMLLNVDYQWRRPIVYVGKEIGSGPNPNLVIDYIKKRIKLYITYPLIEYENTDMASIVADLNKTTPEYDTSPPITDKRLLDWNKNRGVNIVLVPDPANPPNKISFSLRAASLENILNTISTLSNGYTWGVEEGGTVYFRHGGVTGETRIFPMPRSVLALLLGPQAGGGAPSVASSGSAGNPFNPEGPATEGPSPTEIENQLKGFFVRAGALPDDARIAFSGDGKIYVTTNPSALEKLANLLRRYNEVKQVEIESRFLDVQQGVLHELGARWAIYSLTDNVLGNNYAQTGGVFGAIPGTTNLRNLSNAFPLGASSAFQPTIITQPPLPGQSIPQTIPSLPSGINVNPGAGDMFNGVLGVLDGYRVRAIINAIDQSQGSDLMSAPKVTVLSTKTADITVAQVLRYPTDFTAIQSNVSQGNGTPAVTITAGTPGAFNEQQIGVQMTVTPTVEDDDSITLELQPQVTEFSGFIEYGGTSVAIATGTTATVPSGFIQPIFDIRQVRTEVNIYDGATVVMGGLTRDEVKTVNDSIPVLSKIPFLGRLFSSKGETSQKRNLMIFVTASLISPGGSLAKRELGSGEHVVPPGALYESPTIITPGLVERRTVAPPGAAATP